MLLARKKFFILILLSLFCFNSYANSPPDIYKFTHENMFAPTIKNALARVYVPNSMSDTVSVIDPKTYEVIDTYPTGKEPQHVVPSYDLQTLWVLNNKSDTVTPINPNTAKPSGSFQVVDPYNLYFTMDGKSAIVVCEAREELQFRDPHSMKLISSLPIQCLGANHMEFTIDGHYAIVTCEYSAQLMKVDLVKQKVMGYLSLDPSHKKFSKKPTSKEVIITKPSLMKNGFDIKMGTDGSIIVSDKTAPTHNFTLPQMNSMPQDIRSSANGRVFYVADMLQDGVILIDPYRFKKIGFIHTGIGTHAVYPSRDGKLFYISNRGCHNMNCAAHGPGSIAVIDQVKQKVIANWPIPNGGSPDMGNISSDGKELWLSGRYDNEVYVFDTITGKLLHRIPVGLGPHGLAYWPQPGRYSLGHTGNMR